jgi:hypothetical protein
MTAFELLVWSGVIYLGLSAVALIVGLTFIIFFYRGRK